MAGQVKLHVVALDLHGLIVLETLLVQYLRFFLPACFAHSSLATATLKRVLFGFTCISDEFFCCLFWL